MKKLALFISLFIVVINSSCQTYTDFRKPIRIVYAGDTTIIQFTADTLYIYSNLPYLKFNSDLVLGLSLNEIKQAAIDTCQEHPFDTIRIGGSNDYITGDGTNFRFIVNGNTRMLVSTTQLLSYAPIESDEFKIIPQSSAPIHSDGKLYYDTEDDTLYLSVNSTWIGLNKSGGDADLSGTSDTEILYNNSGSIDGFGKWDGSEIILGTDTIANNTFLRSYTVKNYGGGGADNLIVGVNNHGIRMEGNLKWDDSNYELEIDGNIVFHIGSAWGRILCGTDILMDFSPDSIAIRDSLYLHYLTSPTTYGWMVLDSASNVLFVDSLADAGFGLEDKLLPIEQYLKDIKNNELRWYYSENQSSYGLKGLKPTQAVTALQWQTEHLLRYIGELEKQNREYDNRLKQLERMLGIVYANGKYFKANF